MGDKPSDVTTSAVESLQQFQKSIEDQVNGASDIIDNSIASASNLVKSATSTAYEEAQKAIGITQTWYDASLAGLRKADETLISHLKDGVKLAMEHETATAATAIAITALALPATRRLLWRLTIGRFQSAESAQLAAESRISSLVQTIDTQAGEAEKLLERLDLARTDYQNALRKMTGTASELRSLVSRVDGTERKAKAIMRDLRELRSKHALQLRSDVAVKAAEVSKQKNALEKVVHDLAKDGL